MTAAQLPIAFNGKELKEKGMQKALENAERVNPGWKKECYELFKRFVVGQVEPFKMEDFREWVKGLLSSPPSLRAYGSITVRAKKEGLIRHVGYTQVDNPKAHRANTSLWAKI